MSMPDVSEVFSDWTELLQVQIVDTTVTDYEASESACRLVNFEGNRQPVPETKLINKPEGQRTWEWWTLRTTFPLQLDQIVTEQCGRQFRVMTRGNWNHAGGYFEFQIAQDPKLNS